MIIPAFSNTDILIDGWPDPIVGNEFVYAINFTGFLLIYAYFGFGFADDGAVCLVSTEQENVTHRLEKYEPGHKYANVTDRYTFLF